MKKLNRLLKGHKYICFMDFEGTQFSHEMIALGAVLATINPKTGRIKRHKEAIHIYVKAKNKIGKYVTELTGISEDDLKNKGVSFNKAMLDLKKYIGLAFKKTTFVTFGNHDMRIISQSIMYNMEYPKEVTSMIQKNFLDFAAFISEFVKDDNGNPLSLVHYCELFDVKEAGTAHDPRVDAINLMNLYDAFLEKKTLVLDSYKNVLKKPNGHLPKPVADSIVKLASGQDVSAKEFEELLKDYLD